MSSLENLAEKADRYVQNGQYAEGRRCWKELLDSLDYSDWRRGKVQSTIDQIDQLIAARGW